MIISADQRDGSASSCASATTEDTSAPTCTYHSFAAGYFRPSSQDHHVVLGTRARAVAAASPAQKGPHLLARQLLPDSAARARFNLRRPASHGLDAVSPVHPRLHTRGALRYWWTTGASTPVSYRFSWSTAAVWRWGASETIQHLPVTPYALMCETLDHLTSTATRDQALSDILR